MAHSFSRIHLHLVFSTKDRRDAIPKEWQPRLWAYLGGICRNHEIIPLAVGGTQNHVHLLIQLPPPLATAKAVAVVKANSSKWMGEQAHKFAWQEGYGAFSVSSSNLDQVIRYIENQEARRDSGLLGSNFAHCDSGGWHLLPARWIMQLPSKEAAMKSHFVFALILLSGVCAAALPARAQEVTKENVEGVTNFHRLETTVACAGAIKADAVPEIKKFGFASIINLREPTEEGANIEQEAAAAKAVDMRYYSIPFNSTAPDAAAADKFLEAITAKGSDPAFIHCAGGGRAATMWFIKRLVVDHWDVDRAAKEATDLGMTSPKLKQFAIDYAQSHKR